MGGCRSSAESAHDPVCDVKVSARLRHSCSLLASTCFSPHHHTDPVVAELSAAAAAIFRSKFCEALACQGSRGSEDSDAIGFWERSRCRCSAAEASFCFSQRSYSSQICTFRHFLHHGCGVLLRAVPVAYRHACARRHHVHRQQVRQALRLPRTPKPMPPPPLPATGTAAIATRS